MRAAVLRLRSKNTAPGLDGIPGRAWVLALEHLGPRLRSLFSACLEQGVFPVRWKTGKLVLLKKEGRPAEARFWALSCGTSGMTGCSVVPILRGVGVTCYADDTLITATSRTFQGAAILAAVGTGHV
ncbi:uncharacterized protein LOC119191100, partial [Manduca sexta]|uniref:uncharacterized protein LOC119191100 n=1 Tax=Manduca sexta TaxID=7130 RepID=UPI00188EC5CF